MFKVYTLEDAKDFFITNSYAPVQCIKKLEGDIEHKKVCTSYPEAVEFYELFESKKESNEQKKVGIKKKKIFKYATGMEVPPDAIYLSTVTNGDMQITYLPPNTKYVWHYFLVDVWE